MADAFVVPCPRALGGSVLDQCAIICRARWVGLTRTTTNVSTGASEASRQPTTRNDVTPNSGS